VTHTVITLRARSCETLPRAGELMAAKTGTAVYRLEVVTTLRQAGERPGSHRYRLTCSLLAPEEVPPDAAIHPWRWGGRVPRPTTPSPNIPPQGVRGVDGASHAIVGMTFERRVCTRA
jgi:hypothetical protein